MKHRLLITGSRAWEDEQMIRDAIAANIARHGPENLVVVHGACPSGADALTDRIATAWGGGLTVERHPADWDHCTATCHPDHRRRKPPGDTDHPGLLATYCPGAGPRRNAHMVSLGADLCLAFLVAGSRGAAYTANIAERAGILTHRFEA
ncbi:SLOG family protein [Nonomuraea sp. NPDC048882]|uniref:SLOG family protein n=1 Tax=Nonomuraea sp. NPDC048882 TaxID=3154347 RepID=UPI00340AE992